MLTNQLVPQSTIITTKLTCVVTGFVDKQKLKNVFEKYRLYFRVKCLKLRLVATGYTDCSIHVFISNALLL